MKKTPHSPWFGFLSVILFCSFISCSSTEGIDSYFTFNTVETSAFIVDSQTPVGLPDSYAASFILDSTVLAKNGTSASLIQSVKLTKITFKSDDANLISALDSVWISIAAESLPDMLIANYSVAKDSAGYSNADFAAYMKKPLPHWNVHFIANKAPATTQTVSFTYTLVFSAKPQE